MTADDLQENRRVCKFPCTSRGGAPCGPVLGRCLRGGGCAVAGVCPPRQLPHSRTIGRSPARCRRQRACGRRPPARPPWGRAGLRPILPPAPISHRAPALSLLQPLSPANPMSPAGTGELPFTARARCRKSAAGPRCAAAGGAPQGRPARAKPGRPAAAFSPCTGRPKGEKPYPLAPSSSGCSCLPRRAASSAAPVSESSAQRLVGFFRGSSCPKGTK